MVVNSCYGAAARKGKPANTPPAAPPFPAYTNIICGISRVKKKIKYLRETVSIFV